MQRKYTLRPAFLLFVLVSAIFVTFYVALQQDMRQGANDPQIQMAEDMAAALDAGKPPETLLPTEKIDMRASLAQFLIIFDGSGNSIASSVLLDGKIPQVPAEVFDYVRKNGEDRLTWQPESGVRNAAVIVRYHSGFVLAGRSLREVERREDQLFRFISLAWLASVIVIGLSLLFLSTD